MRTITCDNCGDDITSHHNGDRRWRIHLDVEEIPSTAGIRYAMVYQPPVAPGDFCSVRCMQDKMDGLL